MPSPERIRYLKFFSHYYKEFNPIIRQSLTKEQRYEFKRVLKIAIPINTKKRVKSLIIHLYLVSWYFHFMVRNHNLKEYLHFDEQYYLEHFKDDIKNSLSPDQRIEILRIFSEIVCMDKKVIMIPPKFRFKIRIGKYSFKLLIGKERRKEREKLKKELKDDIEKIETAFVMSGLVFLAFIIIIALLIMAVDILYEFKTALNIDLFEEHLFKNFKSF